MKDLQTERFNARLSKEKKQEFMKAAKLGGYKNLTDFMLQSAQQNADKIFEQEKRVLASEEDQKIFFEALRKPQGPNKALKAAAKKYKSLSK